MFLHRASAALSLALLCGAGCATTTTTGSSSPTGSPARKAKGKGKGKGKAEDAIVADRPPPECRPRTLVLAPHGRALGSAVITANATGYALAWSERVGSRHSIRFLAVDRSGALRTPSTEVADGDAPFLGPAVASEADGYQVSWLHGDAAFARKLDGKGRARNDVQKAVAPTATPSASRCSAAAAGAHCTAGDGHTVDLPASEVLVSEAASGDGLALVASGIEGLKLWLLDCAPAPR